MKNVRMKSNNWCLIALLIVTTFHAVGQKKSDQLQSEQDRLEKKLSNTKSLLEKVQTGTKASLNELKILENQVKYREELVQNFDNQIRGAELTISSKDTEIIKLQKQLARLKSQYKKLLLYAYKHRSKQGKMMYIFASSNYFEAVKRAAYLRHVTEIQHKQFKVIQQSQRALGVEIQTIKTEKTKKQALLSVKMKEREKMLRDKEERQKALDGLLQNEKELMAELKADEKQKSVLKRRIQDAIQREIAEAEAKAKREKEKELAREREAKRKQDQAANSKSPSTTNAPTTTAKAPATPAKEKEIVLSDTKDNAIIGRNFESNRGNLPWPVAKGTITEAYGKNPHPTLKNVFTNNNGIDIGAPRNAQVRAVFEGEVTSVLNIPGAGKAIIIKHGNYRTVYSNLQDVYVSEGTKVTTKQTIGSLLSDADSDLSTSHFEIRLVVDGNVQGMNPSLWLSQ